jgi:hypothetical protein
MNKTVIVLFLFIVFISSCCTTKDNVLEKKYPDNTAILPFVKEYKELAKKHKIEFKKRVKIRFKDIDRGLYIGFCRYDERRREVYIDIEFWDRSSEELRRALVFHELTHCYCGRTHDWGKNKNYPNLLLERISNNMRKVDIVPLVPIFPEGYYEDMCPFSLMDPTLVDNYCLNKYKTVYYEEMFDRCEPY